ncbi:MAG: septum site-determining protein MinC [Prochlorococcus marinus CUG1431]|uniref:Septum site-determining protein MinC n=1 Tax=Prochlorococcus marinus CUG1433 TaxID=2774506 RepID=A0A9D9G302_PROMR|nr:septum site-determining protein MinC [Prochlorococcus marinus CUG1433]MBO6980356.1 septum site-determining protein MinC [Prochlorococcus marinus CUG1431]
MKIFVKNLDRNSVEAISFKDFDKINEEVKKLFQIKGPLEAEIFAINESIPVHQLSIFKNNFDKFNNCFLRIYSNNRYTVLAGKSIKIDSIYLNEQEIKNKLLLRNLIKNDNILHEGTVRSGDRISSNGNLCIIGDVNPGAIVSAEKNIVVWGKLSGVAFAGKNGNYNASISSLYLNPLQLRIADVIAIGPNDKPRYSYPEIAVIENQMIIIKPYIIDNKIN